MMRQDLPERPRRAAVALGSHRFHLFVHQRSPHYRAAQAPSMHPPTFKHLLAGFILLFAARAAAWTYPQCEFDTECVAGVEVCCYHRGVRRCSHIRALFI